MTYTHAVESISAADYGRTPLAVREQMDFATHPTPFDCIAAFFGIWFSVQCMSVLMYSGRIFVCSATTLVFQHSLIKNQKYRHLLAWNPKRAGQICFFSRFQGGMCEWVCFYLHTSVSSVWRLKRSGTTLRSSRRWATGQIKLCIFLKWKSIHNWQCHKRD